MGDGGSSNGARQEISRFDRLASVQKARKIRLSRDRGTVQFPPRETVFGTKSSTVSNHSSTEQCNAPNDRSELERVNECFVLLQKECHYTAPVCFQ